ncbi:MAG: hypothetical protein AABY22_25880 [Nanoarchaeota archaeon]
MKNKIKGFVLFPLWMFLQISFFYLGIRLGIEIFKTKFGFSNGWSFTILILAPVFVLYYFISNYYCKKIEEKWGIK